MARNTFVDRDQIAEPSFRLEAAFAYVQPTSADLKHAFDWVYDGYKNVEFKPIDACKNVSIDTLWIEFELVHLNKDMSTDAILAELDRQNLRPALYEELLAFAAKYPELQKQFLIVALGSVCRFDDGLSSPSLDWHDGQRVLSLDWVGDDWLSGCRFLAVRKPAVEESATCMLHVSYAKLPGVAVLEKRFSGVRSVSALFDGRPWERHSSCAKIDETPGRRNFRLAEIPVEFIGKRIDKVRDALAAHFDAVGERFAIETEAVEFSDSRPQLQLKRYWILALGSSAQSDRGSRYVAMLGARRRGRFLGDYWIGYGLHTGVRLLLVRKASSAL